MASLVLAFGREMEHIKWKSLATWDRWMIVAFTFSGVVLAFTSGCGHLYLFLEFFPGLEASYSCKSQSIQELETLSWKSLWTESSGNEGVVLAARKSMSLLSNTSKRGFGANCPMLKTGNPKIILNVCNIGAYLLTNKTSSN